MATKSHLAENALPLHLLFQHPQRLVDIVVTDENLHERSSSMQRMDLAVNGSGGGLLLDSYFSLPDFLPEECHSSVTGMTRNRNSSSSSSRAFAKQSSAIRL